ncbi:uncharacterized protein LOC129908111 [Episyrphus balteatus]|uniref:uncharacterized protein LOC129908111 n=1 Tax=Episyrphus balteatus TaxID=286459 RepID=UPI002485BAED|nr:uncharacterized protein LOC129908111 [Episyrphus balteatus]XP_055840386.1 uncharacterized protein LOC129908111 [Episyrphus balteatus]
MVHRGGIEFNTEKNKKEDFNSCIAENAKTADDDISNNKIEQSAPKAKQIKKSTKKASPKSTILPLSDHSISQTVVRLERSRLIKTKTSPNSKGAETSSSGGSGKSKRLSPVRAGLRSSSLESHTSTTSNNNNAKAKKKKVNTKKAKATDPIECPPKGTNKTEDTKNAQQPKLSKQLPLSFICSLPLNRLSGILEKLKSDKTKCILGIDEDTSSEDKSNIDKNSSQCKTLCLYCDKRMSTVKVRARHIERFHTISKERRSSSRNPVTPSSQDSKDLTGTSPACSSSSAPSTPMSSTTNLYFSGCSYCSKSPKLQAVALENDLSALFFHLVDFHSDKYFGCKACAIRFQTAAKLSDHVQRIHSSSNKNSNPVSEDVKPLLPSAEEERAPNEIGKSTPTKTRRQIKQVGNDSSVSTTTQAAASTSSSSTNINRNGSMFSNDEPILSRLGLTQNRLPRGRKGIRSRRQTNVDSVKPDTSLITVKTRNKLGRFTTSNEPIETVFRTPTNTRIEPLSCTFDEDFYEKVFNNVRTNLSCHLDGKIGSDTDSNRPQSPPPLLPAIRSTVVKSPQILESEVHTATSLAALTAFPTLLTAEQYGCDFGTAKIKRPITRHSWKWKWDSVKKYKYVNEGGKIVKKIKQPMLGLRDLSKLDMWTQLTMRQKHEVVRKQCETTTSQCLVEYTDNSREEKQRQVDQLNTILDSRRLPQIILEQNEQTIIKIEITDEGFRYLAGEVSSSLTPTLDEGPSTSSQAVNRIIPANLNLIPSRSLGESLRQSVVLSGEWARPRCYVCFGCGARFDKRKALEEHKMFRHPHVYSTHYEIVGRELIEGNLYKHFFIPLKALSRHKEYAQRILVNKKTDYSVSKSSSNSGNEEESLDSLHSVTASFTTLSSSKLSDDCDTDTKTAIENVSSFAEPLSPALTTKNDNNSLVAGSSSSMDCTKCNRNCHGMLELYRHMLDCSGDYAWSLAKKKKYRYYGSRKRRQFNRQNISALHLHRRKVKASKDENESDETPKKKYMSPSTPRPRASDADSIRKMLENLPPKRVCREIIPNATKPRSRKFKTTASGRKIQQNSTNKCMTSNTTLTAISKKILRNHKLRAISEKDKITRNKKMLNTKRKSARVKNRVIASKNVHSQNNKANTKTEGRRGGIVRKIGATTKRFVKKIKKRILGDKTENNTSNKNEKQKPTEEDKKSSKTSAVRKLTFDKDQEVGGNTQDNSSQEKTPVNTGCTAEDKEKSDSSKIEKNEPSSSACKTELPTITIETNFETKKLQDTSANEDLSLSLRSEGSTENLHEQQSDLSASTEDLNRLNPGFLHNQVSPTTKRRSKKINDCIAMLTGKIQEKLGKPFLECKETRSVTAASIQSNTEAKLVLPSPEIKETKPTKRKALTRRIVKCDQPSAEANVEVLTPVADKITVKEPELPLKIDNLTEQTTLTKRSSTKQLQMEQSKESLEKQPPLSGTFLKQTSSDKLSVKDTPRKTPKLSPEKSVEQIKESPCKVPKLLPQKSVDQFKESPLKMSKLLLEKPVVLKETPLKVSKLLPEKSVLLKEIPSDVPSLLDPKLKEVLLMKPPLNNPPKVKESYLMESILKESPLKNLPKELQVRNLLKEPPLKETPLHPFKPPFEDMPTNSAQPLRDFHPKKELPVNRRASQAGNPSAGNVFTNNQQLSTSFNTDFRQQEHPHPFATNFKPVPASRVPPPPVTIEITTPAPVLRNDIVPKKISNQPPIQQCMINADTIRVPCINKPPPQQLSIPQFMPVQQQQVPTPAPRGMISKRRQTIAGAPNDFLFEMNSLRCANAYNNLPFELEVPLDLSKKPKRASPKAKQNVPKVVQQPPAPAPAPVHFPQISVKPNAVLMPPVPYQLPLLPQTQIIPILSESLLPNLPPQIPLQNPTLVFPKEITPKPTPSTPRKRTPNNKKQQEPIVVNINPPLVNLPLDISPPKKVSRKTAMPVVNEKLKPNFNLLPIENTNLVKDPVLPMPVESNIKATCKEKTKVPESKKIVSTEEIINLPKQTVTTLEEPKSTPPPAKTILPSHEPPKDQSTPLLIASMVPEVKKPEDEQKIVKVDSKETKKPVKANKKLTQITTTPPKKGSPSSNSALTSSNQVTKAVEPLAKNESKNTSSPESQKSIPTRRSRRNKATEQSELKNSVVPNEPVPPASALKEVEEIAASFVSDDEPENEATYPPSKKQQQQIEKSTVTEKPPEPKVIEPEKPEKSKNEEVVTKKSEPTPSDQSSQVKEKAVVIEPNELVSVANKTESEPQTTKQDSGKKPRRRRKNELASIVADQLMESFKETDKSRIDDLKRLEELAYEKSEDLLLTGMRLMPTTKRKNVLDNNKKDLSTSEPEPKTGNTVKEPKKQKSDLTKEKPSPVVQKEDTDSKPKAELTKEKEKIQIVQKDNTELFKDPKDLQKIETKSKNQNVEPSTPSNLPNLIGKDHVKTKPPPIDFGNYRSNSLDSWSNRGSKQPNSEQVSPNEDKSPTSDIVPAVAQKDKKNKKKQTKKRDKKIETENINLLRTGLESFTLSKDVVDNGNDNVTSTGVTRPSELSHSITSLFSPVQTNSAVSGVAKDASPFGSLGVSNVKPSSSILRPSILAASLDIVASNKENPQPSTDRKSTISSRDPRLNKNIHTEEGDQVSVPPETTSRLATLRTRRKSFADATPPTYTSRANSRSTPSKRGTSASRRNSLAFDDDEDDNFLTAIAKRVNENIMSAEDKDFNLANDGFELANSFIDQEDPFGRPSTSMSVRSAPNFNEDRSNMDTMDATNTDLIDMDVDDDMSVYTTFSQDTTRSKGGRRRRRRRSVLLTRKPKKTNVNMLDSMETFDCLLCNKKFAKAVALNKHQLTIAHVSKVSEQEYLNATRKQEEEKAAAQQQQEVKDVPTPVTKSNTTPPSSSTAVVPQSPKQYFNAIQNIRLEGNNIVPPKLAETLEKSVVEKVHKPQPKVPFIPPNSILNQSGIEPISSPEQNYERYSTKTSSRLTLNPDERLFYECCNILKGSETPLVERTYPIVPPTTYAYDLQVKPVTPKSPNERFSYIKQSGADTNGKRESGSYPRLDVNQFSDISSDSNPACAQPPPVLPVNYAQMHVLSGAKDQAFLANEGGGSGAQRSNLPRESSILQMASIATPSLITPAPLTARTFVNQPSQIGTHLHGMDSSAVIGQKQNFISPLHSASSQSSTITTTTSRLKTKAAMKGYDNLKVSIPTIGLDMEHALERSPRPGCKLTTLADIALGNETPLTTFTPSLQVHNEQKSKFKQKPTNNDIAGHFPTILQSQPKEIQVSPPSKKRDNSPIKESSLVISVHDTESCMPIVLSPPKKPESIIPKDIYEFDDSENTPISKAIQSPFKIAEDNDAGPKKAIIIPERPFKNIGMEEKEAIKFQKPETPAINDENTTSTVTYSDRDDFVYGSMSGGDDDNDNDNDNDDNKETHVESDESSNSSAFTAKTFENKSLIMGRIFKNAKTKPKIAIEKPVLPAPEPPKQIPKQELDRLFDTLRGVNENRQAAKEDRHDNATNSSRKRQTQSTKRKPAVTAAPAPAPKAPKTKTPPAEKPNKRVTKKNEQQPTSKEMSQLHAELGMSPAEIAELIGEGQRKSQRRCAVNRPKKLVEIWSSDEFEEFLSTKDIIALIEEKEQKTKKKRKTASTPAPKKPNSTPTSSKNSKKDIEEQSVTQSEDEKSESAPASPQKRLKNNTPEAAKVVASAAKNTKATKTKKKTPTAVVNAPITTPPAPAPKVTARAQKDKDTKPTSSGKNTIEATKNNSSPFKKPTQKNIISKIAADDSESDFEAELNRRSRTAAPIRNRRKTISGKLENDAGPSSTSCAKKVSAKSKPDKADARNSSKTKQTAQPSQADSSPQSSSRPQARRKRIASEMLYYWSSSSDEEFGRIESPHDDEHHIEENENYQQHGWIVGDSHKKLVTLLAIAKGNKKVDDCGVKETSSKKKS